MKLEELLKIIDSKVIIEIAGLKETYNLKSHIKENILNYTVKTIKPDNNSVLIELEQVETLEKNGYSFEVGM